MQNLLFLRKLSFIEGLPEGEMEAVLRWIFSYEGHLRMKINFLWRWIWLSLFPVLALWRSLICSGQKIFRIKNPLPLLLVFPAAAPKWIINQFDRIKTMRFLTWSVDIVMFPWNLVKKNESIYGKKPHLVVNNPQLCKLQQRNWWAPLRYNG